MRPVTAVLLLLAAGCGGDEDTVGGLFEVPPECEGDPIATGAGRQMLISAISIGEEGDGFDLDGDGEPDNQFHGIGGLAAEGIAGAFARFEIVIPIELFDFPRVEPDDCVKLAVYQGHFRQDGDGDGARTAGDAGDCDDGEAAVGPGAAETAGNFRDDDCDGLADEGEADAPSDDAEDRDADGVTIAAGDCDDTRAEVGAGPEVCGDGLDNDCDGAADWTVGAAAPPCTPYAVADGDAPRPITLDPSGLDDEGDPRVRFTSGRVVRDAEVLVLEAGPSVFALDFPLTADVTLPFEVTGATLRAVVADSPDGAFLVDGRLGGVIDARTADRVHGIDVPQIGLAPDNSLLDGIFANVLNVFLGLEQSSNPDYPLCFVPDVDVDQDGLEIFCDAEPDRDPKVVDVCVDGDGTEVRDEGDTDCTESTADGAPRFRDGLSIELNFATVRAALVAP